MDISTNLKLSSPDVNVFIHAILHQEYSQKYFEELRNSRLQQGTLLETVRKRFDIWLRQLPGAVISFFVYCKRHNSKPAIYLEHVKSSDRDPWMKRYSRYSNVIENMIKRNIDNGRIQEIRREIKNSFDAKVQLFTRTPHFIIDDSLDDSSKEIVFEQLKKLTKNRYHDEEDSEHLALLKHFIIQRNILKLVFFVTEDFDLWKVFTKDIFEWSDNRIGTVCCKDFLENNIPQFMKQ